MKIKKQKCNNQKTIILTLKDFLDFAIGEFLEKFDILITIPLGKGPKNGACFD